LSLCSGIQCFSSGTIKIRSNNTTLFRGTFTNGNFTEEACNADASAVCIGISAWMTAGVTVIDIVKPNSSAATPLILSSNTIVSKGIGTSVEPEPGTLLLMGTGLSSLVLGPIRRRYAKRFRSLQR